MQIVALVVFLVTLACFAWLLRCAVTGSLRIGRGDRGICFIRSESPGAFWFISFVIGVGLVFPAVVSGFILSIGRGYQVHKYHEFVVADGPPGTNSAGTQVVLRVLETGTQYLAVVDGPTRRTSFGGAEYVLRSVDTEIPLKFLDVFESGSVWDNFIHLDGKWFAFNFIGPSLYYEDQVPRVEVVVFIKETELDRFAKKLPCNPCEFSAAWVQKDGESVYWLTKQGDLWSCPLEVQAEPIEVSQKEFDVLRDSLLVLDHKPVWLEFTHSKRIQLWCS